MQRANATKAAAVIASRTRQSPVVQAGRASALVVFEGAVLPSCALTATEKNVIRRGDTNWPKTTQREADSVSATHDPVECSLAGPTPTICDRSLSLPDRPCRRDLASSRVIWRAASLLTTVSGM